MPSAPSISFGPFNDYVDKKKWVGDSKNAYFSPLSGFKFSM